MTRPWNRLSMIQTALPWRLSSHGKTRTGRPRSAIFEPLEVRSLLSVSPATIETWHNSSQPADVNGDGIVSPLDSLIVINDLNANGPHTDGSGSTQLSSATGATTHNYLDVNGDGSVSPLDALSVLNSLTNPPQLVFSLQATDTSGTPITTIQAGQPFEIEAFVEDPNGTAASVGPPKVAATGGVYAAYANVAFNPALATVSSSADITYGADYQNVPGGDLSAAATGELGEVGATATGTKPLGPGEFLLWTLPVTAKAAGAETFTPSFNSSVEFGNDIFGQNTSVPADDIEYLPANIQITSASAQPTASIGNVTQAVGTSGTTPFVFTVTLSAASAQNVLVTYATADGTAHAPGDYTAESGTLTFAAGTTAQTVTVPVAGTAAYQPSETFSVDLTGATNANISGIAGIGTITNTNPAPTLTINSPTALRPATGTGNAVFTVTLAGATNVAATVAYATADGTAHAPGDYTAESGTLTFAPGTTLQNITVPVIGNTSSQNDETFTVNLSNPTNALPSSLQGTATIHSFLSSGISVNDIVVDQPTSGTTNAVFTVTTPASNQTVTVAYNTADGTATAPGTYTAASGTLTFAPSVTSQLVTVVVQGNATPAPDEDFYLNLSSPTNAGIVRDSAAATVHNTAAVDPDLVGIRLEIDDLSGNPITTPLLAGQNFQVEAFVTDLRPPASAEGVFAAFLNVSYQTALAKPLGTIEFGPAYQSFTSGDVTSQPGEFVEIGAIATSSDPNAFPVLGPGEQLLFAVPMVATGSGNLQFTGTPATIFPDHDVLLYGTNTPVPVSQVAYLPSQILNVGANSFSINNVTQTDVASGTTNFVFTVTRATPTATTATVVYATADGTAKAPGDYTAESGTLTFAPGTTTQNITVPVIGTTLDEPDKTFFVNLSNAVNAAISTSQGTGTIHYNNPAPSVTIAAASATEGQPVVFTATLSQASGFPITVAYSTVNGTALAGINFTSTSGTLTFAAGTTTQTISVPTIATLTQTGNLQFKVQLASPVNVTIGTTSATGTIQFLQPATISGFVYIDANGNGQKDTGEIGIQGVAVTATSLDGTVSKSTITASDGSYSFVGLKAGTYNVTEIQPGFYVNGTPSSNMYANVVVQNGVVDGNLNFGELGLRAQFVNAFFNRRAYLASTEETGAYGLPTGTQNVDLTQGDIWVSFDDGWQGARKFEALFNSAQGTATLTLYDNNFNVLATSTPETAGAVLIGLGTVGSTYFLKISGTSTNASLKITESLSVADASVIEGNTGTNNMVFNVTLSAPEKTAVTVAYATADGTALAGVNYFAESGTLTFAAGMVSQSVTVPILGSTKYGPNETFALDLSNPVGAFVYRQGTGTIVNQNPPPSMSITDTNLFSPATGTANAIFAVSLAQASGLPATVTYATVRGTLPQSDFIAQSGTLTFAPGTLIQNITVPVRADSTLEANETFFVKLTGAVGAVLIKSQGMATIMPPSVTAFSVAPSVATAPAVSTALFTATPAATASAGSTTNNSAVGQSSLLGSSTKRSAQSQATDQVLASAEFWRGQVL
jgi:hypothetical protein